MIPFPRSRLVPSPIATLLALTIAWSVLYGALLWTISDPLIERPSQQQAQHAMVVSYVTGPVGANDAPGFLAPDERAHMRDVKWLFDAAFFIHLALLGASLGSVAVLAYRKLWRFVEDALSRGTRWGGWSVIAVMAIVAMAAALDFGRFWLLFHALLFPQGNWMFAADSALITIYPESYFSAFVQAMALRAGISAAILVLLGAFLGKARAAQDAFSARFPPGGRAALHESSKKKKS